MLDSDRLRRLIMMMVADGSLDADAGMALIRRAREVEPATAETHPAEPAALSRDIAVVGMAGRFGNAPDLEAYWRLLEAGKDCLVEMPARRWPTVVGTRRKGGFLPDEDQFDPLFFRISPTEAAMMDPQQRLFLETAYHALEDAGYAEAALSGTRCGVFVGVGVSDYAQRFRDAGLDSNPLGLMGNVTSILAARISYFLNLKGPSVALDSACSSSLVAVHLACESLIGGTCDMALAGGVAVISTTQFIGAMMEGGMLSPSDRCSSFDASADGFVCGEGSGVVVLKRLADALRDGDFIHGVIRGSGINQDGRTNGITAPSAPSQAALEVEVYRRAGVDPATLSYVETHGTGTPLGDPIEFEALTSSFRHSTAAIGFCALGSAKANIGHTLTAAGIAGLLKLLLMLRHHRIPPMAGFSKVNPRIDLAASPFTVPTVARDWVPPGPRRAAVSSFGFSGTNAHVVVEEAPQRPRRKVATGPFLFLLSGRTKETLRKRALALAARLATPDLDPGDLAFTLATGREHHAHRLAVVAEDAAGLLTALQRMLAGERDTFVFVGETMADGPGPAMLALGESVAHETPDLKRLLILADLYHQGAVFTWRTLAGTTGGRRIPLPVYPFVRTTYGIALPAAGAAAPVATLDDGLMAVEAAFAQRAAPDLGCKAQSFQAVEAWGRMALAEAYAAMGLFRKPVHTSAGLRRRLGIVAPKQRLHEALVDMLVRDGILQREGDLLRARDKTCAAFDRDTERQRLADAEPELAPFLTLLAQCVGSLPKLLSGQITATEVMFPDGRMDLVEPIYQGNQLAEHFNLLLADATAILAANLGRPARVLEIGAGTGGATTGIVAKHSGIGAYHYTDISRGFVHTGQQRFAADYPFMQFATLDIEHEPIAQGFPAGGFDLIVASNVLHASRDISVALRHAGSLLAPGGFLLLNEVTALQDYATLTFGLTDGWWAFEDVSRRIANAPLLDVAGWRDALAAGGFPRMTAFGLPGEGRDRLSQSMIVAQRSAAPTVVPSTPSVAAPIAAQPLPPMETDALMDVVAREVAGALTMEVTRIDRRGRFMDYGIDSILGSQLVAKLNKTLGLDLRPTVLFDHPSVRDLAGFIEREHGAQVRLPAVAPRPVVAATPEARDERIAVIGLAGRFADAPDIASFHAMLREGRSGITEVPADRWSADAESLPEGVSSEAKYLRWGGFLKDAGDFDPLFFRISGKEAELTDPQHRVFLTEAWRALEDAGYAERELDGRRCGVFVGAYGGDYTHRMTNLGIVPEAFAFMGNAAAILSARIAYVLNLKGPCLAVDTACSSSLTAVHLACRSLLDGDCDMALAGGVFLTTTMGFNTAAAKAGMLSPLGACRTFDAEADGFVPGEGAGVVVLKPYAKALADGDHIEAIILASAINQDGRTNGITAPSPESQAALETEVYRKAGINPEAISYIEAHGTGTKLGDPIEIQGLTRAFRHWTDRTGFCAIGSVKTNIGHAAHAAGIAGLLKVVLSLRHRTLFPSLNFRAENTELRLKETPFFVNTALRAWETGGKPRLAAVSSFGFSGTNMHILLTEAEPLAARPLTDGACLITLSARSRPALGRKLAELRAWLGLQKAELVDISRTLNEGRGHFDYRWAAVVTSRTDLDAALALGTEQMRPIDLSGNCAPALLTAAEIYLRTGEIAEIAIPAEGRRIAMPTYPFEMRRYWLDRPTERAVVPDAKPAIREVNYLAPQWQVEPLATGAVTGAIWLVTEGGALATNLMRLWRSQGLEVKELRPTNLGTLDRPRTAPIAVIHLLGLDEPEVWDSTTLDAQLARGPGTIVPLLQKLFAESTRLLVVHRGHPTQECVQAFRRSVRFDGAEIDIRLLRIDGPIPEVGIFAQWISAEIAGPHETTTEVTFRDGHRLVRRMLPVEPPGRAATLRAGGHFLLTGGGGVLAGVFARRLAAMTGGRITLIGRSPAGEAVHPTLEALGTSVTYRQADVTDQAWLAQVVAQARADYGPIHGIIHAAGAPGGTLLRDSDWVGMVACLAPKVAGTVTLDHVLRDEPLDFFVSFSSLAGELGDFGQGAYALANAFSDRFALWREGERAVGRRHGRSLAIGWPLWREGRGVLSPEGERIYLAVAGMPYLETEQGWQGFLDALAMPHAQIAVVPGERAAALALFIPPVKAMAAAYRPDLHASVRRHLTTLISRQMKIEEDLLGGSTGLAEFGFDSIALKEFGVRLGEAYGITISPAVFFARGTIDALTAYLIETHPKTVAATHSVAPPLVAVASAAVAPKPPATEREPIAIIGLSGRFPGSPDLRHFWRNLEGGADLVGPLPEGRDLASQAGYDRQALVGGFLDRIDTFDAPFFRISPREACFLDPQHRLAIEAVWHCVEDAGLRMGSLAGRSVGVFFGPQVNEYGAIIPNRDAARAQIALGNIATMLPNRISYLFDLRGPSEAIDTACSSSLVAVHRAVRALQDGECEMAFAGGVSLVLTAENVTSTAELGVLSPDGRCHSFDCRANGYVKGEGVGVVLLKPLAQAEADGDVIHGVILGSAENHGGHGHSLTAPNGTAQAALIAAALRCSGVSSDTIGYVEAHGTGTELGDPVEVLALKDAFAATAVAGSVQQRACALGTVKTNIGHLEPASGIAGLIKVVLALEHRILPASLHFEQLNPLIDLANTPFSIVDRTRFWDPLTDHAGQCLPRRAGVSSFGLGGSNAHVVVEERIPPETSGMAARPELLVVSARDRNGLQAVLRRLAAFVGEEPQVAAADIAQTLLVGREAMEVRAALLWRPGQSLDVRLAAAADAISAGADLPDLWVGSVAKPDIERGNDTGARQFMADLLANAQLGRMAALWVGGADLPAGVTQGRRISLPGYPFARMRFWFDRETVTAPLPVVVAPSTPPVAVPVLVSSARTLIEARAVVRRHLARALYLEESQLDDRAGFVDLGLDSILAVELSKSLNDELGSSLQAARLYDYANVSELAGFLYAESRPRMESPKAVMLGFPVAEFLIARLSEIDPRDLTLQTKLNAIPMQPDESKAILAAVNARFGSGLVEADVGRCVDLSDLVSLIASSIAHPPALPARVPMRPSAADSVRTVVRQHLAKALYLEVSQLDDHAGFADLGLDSILAVELAKSLNDTLGTRLQATRLYDHANIAELSGYLVTSLEEDGGASGAVEASPAGVFLIAKLAEIGARDLTLHTRLDSIAMQPAEAHAILTAVNARFGCALIEDDVGRCADLGGLAILIGTRSALSAEHVVAVAPEALTPLLRKPEPEVLVTQRPAPGTPAAVVASAPDVAIIGYACRLPGAPDADAFWSILCGGQVAITPYPTDAWRRDIYRSALEAAGSDITPWGGYVTGVDEFDPRFFNIRPEQVSAIDPVQRLFLQTAWHALEMAGQDRARLDGAECGVFVGGGPSDYSRLLEAQAGVGGGEALLGNTSSILAARIAYFLNLHGPCLAIDTACSSGLVAMHAAWRAILDGEMDMAVVGGVNLMLTPQMHMLTGAGGMLSADGHCRSFDNAADGFVPAEGVVALVLKRLDRALADGDPVQGVIRGVAINQNGASAGITAPSARAQMRLVSGLYERAGIAAAEIGLVEAHGTGTKIGDALEFDALRQVFVEAGSAPGGTVLASAKPAIGHTFAASGLASVVKLLLAMRHLQIPPMIGPLQPNEYMRLQGSPFRIGTTLEPWRTPPGGLRMGATTTYGLSGTNAHVVLAEPPVVGTAAASVRARHVVPVSGLDDAALQRQVQALSAALAFNPPDLGDLAYTLGRRRTHFARRAVFVVHDIADLRCQLAQWPETVTGEDGDEATLIAAAFANGGVVNWQALYPSGRVCGLPGYRFATERFWPDAAVPVERAPISGPVPSTGDVQDRLRDIIARVLRIDAELVTANVPFEMLGLDSASGVALMRMAEVSFGVAMPVIALWDHPTLEHLASFVAAQPKEIRTLTLAQAGCTAQGEHDPVVVVRIGGNRQPFFWVHGGPGDVNWVPELARNMAADATLYALEAVGLDGDSEPLATVEAMAAHYVTGVLRTQPAGPYCLGGYSAGGAIAFEMARQLTAAGHIVGHLILLDANVPASPVLAEMQVGFGPGYVYLVVGNWFGSRWGMTSPLVLSDFNGLDKSAMLDRVVTHLFAHAAPPIPQAEVRRYLFTLDRVGWAVGEALRAYRPARLEAPIKVILFECGQGMVGRENPLGLPDSPAAHRYRDGWDALFVVPIERVAVDCDHFGLLRGSAGQRVGSVISMACSGADRVRNVVLSLVREILPDVPTEAITPDCSMDDLGATSMDRVEVATRAMETLGITVPNRKLSGITSIGALIDLMRRHAGHG